MEILIFSTYFFPLLLYIENDRSLKMLRLENSFASFTNKLLVETKRDTEQTLIKTSSILFVVI